MKITQSTLTRGAKRRLINFTTNRQRHGIFFLWAAQLEGTLLNEAIQNEHPGPTKKTGLHENQRTSGVAESQRSSSMYSQPGNHSETTPQDKLSSVIFPKDQQCTQCRWGSREATFFWSSQSTRNVTECWPLLVLWCHGKVAPNNFKESSSCVHKTFQVHILVYASLTWNVILNLHHHQHEDPTLAHFLRKSPAGPESQF